MTFEPPLNVGFTVYSKSGCGDCIKVKNLLKEKNIFFHIVVCDEYLIENKSEFLEFIEDHANMAIKTFPIVFYNSNLVGGYLDTKTFIQKLQLKFDDY